MPQAVIILKIRAILCFRSIVHMSLKIFHLHKFTGAAYGTQNVLKCTFGHRKRGLHKKSPIIILKTRGNMLLQHTLYEPENFPPHKHKELHTTTETYAGVTVER